MSTFYGVVQGSRRAVTRCGTRGSGLTTTAASWAGAIRTRIEWIGGEPHFYVEMIPWHGAGEGVLLASGRVGDSSSVRFGPPVTIGEIKVRAKMIGVTPHKNPIVDEVGRILADEGGQSGQA